MGKRIARVPFKGVSVKLPVAPAAFLGVATRTTASVPSTWEMVKRTARRFSPAVSVRRPPKPAARRRPATRTTAKANLI